LASWEDMKLVLQEHGAAEKQEGFTASRFRLVEGAVTTHEDPVEVLRLRDGLSYLAGAELCHTLHQNCKSAVL